MPYERIDTIMDSPDEKYQRPVAYELLEKAQNLRYEIRRHLHMLTELNDEIEAMIKDITRIL